MGALAPMTARETHAWDTEDLCGDSELDPRDQDSIVYLWLGRQTLKARLHHLIKMRNENCQISC